MKKALILGCSHAAGSEIECHEPDLCDQFQRRNSFASLIASDLGYEPHNLSIPGGSNEAMFRLFCEHGKDFDLVIAVWTGVERKEIYKDKHGWLPMSHGQIVGYPEYNEYGRHWIINETGAVSGNPRKIRCVLALNMLAQYQKIPVINANAFQPITDFDWPHTITWLKDIDFCKWCFNHGYPSTAMGHYQIEAHRAYALANGSPEYLTMHECML